MLDDAEIVEGACGYEEHELYDASVLDVQEGVSFNGHDELVVNKVRFQALEMSLLHPEVVGRVFDVAAWFLEAFLEVVLVKIGDLMRIDLPPVCRDV